MANCKICGQPVRCATVHHAACWERAVEKAASKFCDNYCRWPRECQDEDELIPEENCVACALTWLRSPAEEVPDDA